MLILQDVKHFFCNCYLTKVSTQFIFNRQFSVTLVALVFYHLLFFSPAVVLAEPESINFSADTVNYESNRTEVVCTGTVKLQYKTVNLTAGKMKLNLDTKQVTAEQNVVLDDTSGIMYCNKLNYDLDRSTGYLWQSRMSFSPWYMRNKLLKKFGDKKFTAAASLLTGCVAESPHYHLSTGRVNLFLDDHFTAYNAILFIGKVPVFYLPWYHRTLKPRKLTLITYPGYSDSEGIYLRNVVMYPFSPQNVGKLYLDYFSEKGVGFGTEYNYFYPETVKGTVRLRSVYEQDSGKTRGSLEFKHWQNLIAQWTATADVSLYTDDKFTGQYLRDEWYRIIPDITSTLAVTQSQPNYTLRIATVRRDYWDVQRNMFVTRESDLPQLSLNTQSLPIAKLPVYYTINSNVVNRYTQTQGYYLLLGNNDLGLRARLPIVRDWMILPQTGWRQKWQVLLPTATDTTTVYLDQHYFYTSTISRVSLFRSLNFDLGYETEHQFVQQYQTTLTPFPALSSRGTVNLDLRPGLNWNLYTTAGYNFINKYWEPTRVDLNLRVWDFFKVQVANEYDVNEVKLNSVYTELGYDVSEWQKVTVGVSYYTYQSTGVSYNCSTRFKLGRNLYLDLRLRQNIIFTVPQTYDLIYIDKDVVFVWDFHCWVFKFNFRQRMFNNEVWATADLKLGAGASAAPTGKDIYPVEQEREFYPWR